MGDISTEPSMEDILSSIKRIISEDGEPVGGRVRRGGQAAPTVAADAYEDEDLGSDVLELKDALRGARGDASAPGGTAGSGQLHAIRAPEAVASEPRLAPGTPAALPPVGLAGGAAAAGGRDPILSDQAAQASRGALDALSRLMIKPEAQPGIMLDDLVRDMLRPMLRDWLDSHLPGIVENMVSREIERITGNR